MHLHTHWATPWERAASVAVASCVTAGATLLILAALGPTFGRPPAPEPAEHAPQVTERIEFLAPREAPADVPLLRPLRRPPARAAAPPTGDVTAREAVAASPPDSGARAPQVAETPATATPTPVDEASVRMPRAPSALAGAPRASATVGIRRESAPIRFDSVLRVVTDSIGTGLLVGAIKASPTQAEVDAKWRDEAFEVAAARGAGRPYIRSVVGFGIPIGLPFGGPSREERERNRAIEAELQVLRAQRRARIDSIVAERRRLADSVARADSLESRRSRERPPFAS